MLSIFQWESLQQTFELGKSKQYSMYSASHDPENMSFSEENILANSIRIAREKLGIIDQQNSRNHVNKDSHNQTFSFSKPKKQSSAAQAIKVLHGRIAQLQAFNVTLTKEVSQTKREINLKNIQIQSLHNQRSELQQKFFDCKQKLIKAQTALKEKDLQLLKFHEIQKQKDNALTEQIKNVDELLKIKVELSTKVDDLNKKIGTNQKIIGQMITQLTQERQKNKLKVNNLNTPQTSNQNGFEIHRNSKSAKSKEMDFPVIIDEPESSKYGNRFSNKNQSSSKPRMENKQKNESVTKKTNKGVKSIEIINKQLRQKNQQLYNMLKTADRKCKEQEKQKKTLKERFYSLKCATDSMIEEINRLPNNLIHKFKCLIVKVKKIESEDLQFLRSHSMLYQGRHYSKSSRHSSKQSQRSSKSKQKKLKMQDLNLSDHNMSQTKSSSKQKRRSTTMNMKSHSGKKKLKPNYQVQEEDEIMKVLKQEIHDQRKQMRDLHMRINNQTDEQKKSKLSQEFQEKMIKNNSLVNELEALKKKRERYL